MTVNIIYQLCKHSDSRQVFAAPKTIQATVTLLENLHIVVGKSNQDDLLAKEILPMLFNSFDSSTVQVQV